MTGKDTLVSLAAAVRSGRYEEADACFARFLSAGEVSELIGFTDAALAVALRCEKKELFQGWILKARVPLHRLLAQPESQKALAELLKKLAFAILDRRLEAAFGSLKLLLLRFFYLHRNSEHAAALWRELLNLTVRMARRGWEDDVAWLYRLLLHALLSNRDRNEVRGRLWQLQLHFTMYAKCDSIEGATKAFGHLFCAHILLLRRLLNKGMVAEEKALWLRVMLHSLRELTNNLSRILMMDDAEIFCLWHDLLARRSWKDARLKDQFKLMLWLAVEYWLRTMPKTGRRQSRYLEELKDPGLVSDEVKKLLSLIC